MEIIKLKDKETVSRIRGAFEEGKVVALPTDTVYGFMADAINEKAVQRIFAIKKRPLNKPIGIFVRDIKMAKKFAEVDKSKEGFFKKYWPGQTTFILSLNENSSRLLFAGDGQTIGMRIPDYKLFHWLFEQIDFPLAQTSANLSGNPSPTKVEEIIEQFKNQELKPDLIVDGGDLGQNKPSTVIDLTGQEPKILRQ